MFVNSTKIKREGLDRRDNFFLLLSLILFFGILMVYDASSVYAQRLLGGDSFYFARLQFFWILLGLIVFFIFSRIKLLHLRYYSIFFFGVTLLFLGALSLTSLIAPCSSDTVSSFGFFPCLNSARRWIYLNPPPLPAIPFVGILSFQASELAKFALIMFLPHVLEKTLHFKGTKKPFFLFLIVCGLLSFLVLAGRNMSNAALIFAIGCAIYYISGAKVKYLFALVPLVFLLLSGAILSSPYRMQRLTTFLSRETSQSAQIDESYQISQISIALGRGGFLGVGLGQSKQKLSFTPEVYADSIFAIVGEELGFLGTTFLVILFSLFILNTLDLVAKSTDPYERMVGVGIASWIYFQFLINVFAMVKLIPLTGMPIPLFSYGGSSMIFTMSALGVLYSIKRSHRK